MPLKKIKTFRTDREKAVDSYTQGLAQLPLDLPRQTVGARSSWHLYPVCVREGEALRNRVMGRLRQAGILANLHYLPVPKFQFYRRHTRQALTNCPLAEKFAQREISLPLFPAMGQPAVSRVVSTLRKALG